MADQEADLTAHPPDIAICLPRLARPPLQEAIFRLLRRRGAASMSGASRMLGVAPHPWSGSNMSTWQLVFASVGRRTIYLDRTSLLRGLHTLVRCTRGVLAMFCIVDDHVHLVVEAEDPGRLTGSLSLALAATTPMPSTARTSHGGGISKAPGAARAVLAAAAHEARPARPSGSLGRIILPRSGRGSMRAWHDTEAA